MATIKKRGKNFCVIYDYKLPNGENKTKWESGFNKADAELRKSQVEYELKNGTFLIPNSITVTDFMFKWVDLHATKKKWAPSTYSSAMGYIKNHIMPHIGNIELQKLNSLHLDTFYNTLSKTKKGKYVDGKLRSWDYATEKSAKYLSSTTIKEIHDLIRCAMSCAVDWKILKENPAPREGPQKRKVETAIWDDDMMYKALKQMDDELLHLLVHIMYIGSLRVGEAGAICIEDINLDYNNMGCVRITKTIQRATKAALEAVPKDNILKIFPTLMEGKKSCLIFKTPKTDKSKRLFFLTEQLKEEIKKRLAQIEKDKKLYGDRYFDYGLLICQPNGLPMEPSLCLDRFKQWQAAQEEKFPPLVTHGIRHSSSTYKLILSQGDFKAVQGDTGHATAAMLMDTYAHVQDKSRMKLTQNISMDFYDRDKKKTEPENNIQSMLIAAVLESPTLQATVLSALLAQKSG